LSDCSALELGISIVKIKSLSFLKPKRLQILKNLKEDVYIAINKRVSVCDLEMLTGLAHLLTSGSLACKGAQPQSVEMSRNHNLGHLPCRDSSLEACAVDGKQEDKRKFSTPQRCLDRASPRST
jgi:hypothetical protein